MRDELIAPVPIVESSRANNLDNKYLRKRSYCMGVSFFLTKLLVGALLAGRL